MIRNFGRFVLLVLLLAFVLPILPYAIALAQSTAVAAAAIDTADTTAVVRDSVFPWGGLVTAIVTAVISAIAAYFSAHRGAKVGVVAGHEEVRSASKVPKADRF